MTNEGWIERQTKSDEARKRYEQERLILWATEEIAKEMDRSELTQAEVAGRLDVSAAHVSQLLSGERNMTLRSLANLAYACGVRVDIELEPLRDGEYVNYPMKMEGAAKPQKVELDTPPDEHPDRGENVIQANTNPLAA